MANPIEPTKKDHGTALIAIPARSGTPRRRPPMYTIAYRPVAPAITMSMGIRIAQAEPKMVCL